MDTILKAAATLALIAIAFAAVWFAVSWRQHFPPCPNIGHNVISTPRSCFLAP